MKPRILAPARPGALSFLIVSTAVGGLQAATINFTNTADQNIANIANWSGGTPTFGTVAADRWNINGITTYTAAQGTTTLTGDRGLVVGAVNGTAATTYQLTVSGGTLNFRAATSSFAPLIGAGTNTSYAATSELVLSGGNVNVLNADGTANSEIGLLARGSSTAKGILTINSGSTLSADLVSFGTVGASTGTGIINLNEGGTLKARGIWERNDVANTQINFNGGTLMSNDTNHSEDWIRTDNGGPVVTIGTLGATFDSNGQLGQRINTVMGGAGAVTIKDSAGSGAVVFNANNTYSGSTTIQAGSSLYLGSSSTAGSVGSGSVTNQGTLALNRTDTVTQSAANGLALGLNGGGTLIKTNSGVFIADVANSHTGLTDVATGIFRVTHAGAFGSTNSGTQVRDDGQIQLTGGVTITGESLVLSTDGDAVDGADTSSRYLGGLHSLSGTNTWAGSITIGHAANSRLGAQSGAVLRVTGAITGAAGYDLIIRNANNGVTELSGGGSWANTRVYNGTLRLGAHNGVATNSRLIVGNAGLFGTVDMNGYNQTVASLGDGSTAAADHANERILNRGSADSTLTIDTSESRTYSGSISDGSTNRISIVKQGSGTQILAGTNTYTGPTLVTAGTLTVNGTSSGSAHTVGNGAILAGFGTINAGVDLSGTLAPGLGGTSDRTLAINGNVTTHAGSQLSFRIQGTNTGQFDQLAIGQGSEIDLSGATLALSLEDQNMDVLNPGEDWTTGASIYQIITGTTTGMFANATLMDLSALNLGSSEYVWTDPLSNQVFWLKQGSISLVPIAIPEPGPLVLGGIAALIMPRRRRKH